MQEPEVGANTEMGDVRRILHRIESTIEDQTYSRKKETILAREWRTIGQCFDRLFFILYACMIVTSLLVCFPKPREDVDYY